VPVGCCWKCKDDSNRVPCRSHRPFFLPIACNQIEVHCAENDPRLVNLEYTPPHKRETFYPFCGNRFVTHPRGTWAIKASRL
jgi:hypothetical protein